MEVANVKKEADPNPPYGEKGGFRKITITLPLGAYKKLMEESVRRKIAGEPNQLLSALIREAASCYFDGRGLEQMDAGPEWTIDEKNRSDHSAIQN
jgi:transcriptional regulator of met regulon